MNNTVLFVGAGLSAAAGIPTTGQLLAEFAKNDASQFTPPELQAEITQQLQRFWKHVFGWNRQRPQTPTFEDHFTALDLAANTGHQLGSLYSPRKLRAIRRLSLHRVFETLDKRFSYNARISTLMGSLVKGSRNAVISTNWDVVVEKHLRRIGAGHNYGIPVEPLGREVPATRKIKLLKLHGSANWCYCDSCRRLFSFASEDGKGTYKSWLFLERRDFDALVGEGPASKLSEHWTTRPAPQCRYCNARLSARVATFSFEKALGFYQFQGVWEEALRVLRMSEHWIFLGYSLPEADFELRHLLKTAQLAGGSGRKLKIEVVLKGDANAVIRFRRFFGARIWSVSSQGLDRWVDSRAKVL